MKAQEKQAAEFNRKRKPKGFVRGDYVKRVIHEDRRKNKQDPRFELHWRVTRVLPRNRVEMVNRLGQKAIDNIDFVRSGPSDVEIKLPEFVGSTVNSNVTENGRLSLIMPQRNKTYAGMNRKRVLSKKRVPTNSETASVAGRASDSRKTLDDAISSMGHRLQNFLDSVRSSRLGSAIFKTRLRSRKGNDSV